MPKTAKRCDKFWSNSYESGLWHLALITFGILGIMGLLTLLYYTINYLKYMLVEPVDQENSF